MFASLNSRRTYYPGCRAAKRRSGRPAPCQVAKAVAKPCIEPIPEHHLLAGMDGWEDPSGVVVLTPQQGETASYPLRVSGYSRTFEAHVVAEVRQGGAKVAATSGLSSDCLKTWGEFNLTVDTGPKGPIEIFVGDYSPANGQEVGVYIPLTMQ